MFIYFCIYSFLGYFMESFYISCFQKKWLSSGLLDGPYIPLYGFGAMILILVSPYLKASYFLTFITCSILMTTLEYVTSLYLEKVFHQHIWDYSHYKYNYQGRICLFYSILWGFLSILFIFYLHPYLSSLISFNNTSAFLSIIMITIMMKDTLLQLKNTNYLN